MHAGEDIEAFIESAAIDHIEDLTPHEDIEDEGAGKRVRVSNYITADRERRHPLEFGLRDVLIDWPQSFWSDEMQGKRDDCLIKRFHRNHLGHCRHNTITFGNT